MKTQQTILLSTIRRFSSLAAMGMWAGIVLLAPLYAARAQCNDVVADLEGVTAAPGLDGEVKAMVEWDPDGPTGAAPNLMVLAGDFVNAPNLSALNGLVGWDGSQFVRITPQSGQPNSPSLLTTWSPNGPGSQPTRLVAVQSQPEIGGAFVNWTDGQNWDITGQFFSGGTISAVTTWDPDGPGPLPTWLIIGGDNLVVGDVGPTHLLRFDGTNWASLAEVVSTASAGNTINVLQTWDFDGPGPFTDALVIGGQFTQLDGAQVGNLGLLVNFDGTFVVDQFSGGVNGPVRALQPWDAGAPNKYLVIGGDFSSAGPYSVSNLVIWTGSDYYGFAGAHSDITSMAIWDPDGAGPLGGRLVMNGVHLAAAGLLPAIGVAYYDPASGHFIQVGTSLVEYDVGFVHTLSSGKVIGVWDAAGDGLQPQFLFAGGPFLSDGGGLPPLAGATVVLNHIARINTGSTWLQLPSIGPHGTVNALAYADIDGPLVAFEPRRLYVGGSFDQAGPKPASNIAGWNGATWDIISSLGSVNCFFTTRGGRINPIDGLYAGTADGVFKLRALTPGYAWDAQGTGVNGPVNAITFFDFDGTGPNPALLVVGGSFTTAGGSPANRIAVFDSSTGTWSALGTGMNDTVNALAIWDPDGSGPQPARVVAGGAFTSASGISISHLATWDGVQWQPFEGGGINGTVNALSVWTDPASPNTPRLVVGGQFSQAGGTPANNIAVWSNGQWNTAIGSGVLEQNTGSSPAVYAIGQIDLDGPYSGVSATSGSELIIGGVFNSDAFGTALGNLARWDPVSQRWLPAGSVQPHQGELGAMVKCLLPFSVATGQRPKLLVGGRFTWSGGTAYYSDLAIWSDSEPYISSVPPAQFISCPGSTVTLSTTVLGTNLVYRWQRDSTNLFPGLTGTGSSLSGVDTATLTIVHTSAADDGAYTCNVFGPCGNTTTAASQLAIAPDGCDPDTPTMMGVTTSNGMVAASFSGAAGYQYVVQRSIDLTNWITLVTNTIPPEGLATYVDNAPPQAAAFYRTALLLP